MNSVLALYRPHRLLYHIHPGSSFTGFFGQNLPPQTAAGLPRKQHQHVAGNFVELEALAHPVVDVGQHRFYHLLTRGGSGIRLPKPPIHLGKPIGIVVGRSPHHHPIDWAQLFSNLLKVSQPAVNFNPQVRKVLLQAVDIAVAQGRHRAVVLGAQPLQPGFAGMDGEVATASLGHGADEVGHVFVAIQIVNANAVLNADG